MTNRDHRNRAILWTLAAVLFLTPALWAQEEGEAAENQGFLAFKGRVTYRVYCASCHGAEAKGDGAVAKWLTVPPSDLTLIQRSHDGEFPAEEVQRIIDGRKTVRAHGKSDMPVWGDVFQSKSAEESAEEDGEARAERKIRELVAFLKSIQVQQE